MHLISVCLPASVRTVWTPPAHVEETGDGVAAGSRFSMVFNLSTQNFYIKFRPFYLLDCELEWRHRGM